MIKITLEFADIIDALAALTAISADGKPLATKLVANTPAPAESPKPQPEKPKAAPKAAAAPSTPAAPAASTASSTVDYASLQKAVFNLANKSREAASAVVAAFGVKTFRDLPADKWESALTAVNAKLAFLEKAE